MINNLFNKPKIIGVVGDVNTGKSMTLYNILEGLAENNTFNLYYYGLRLDFEKVASQRVYSVAELESIQDSIIIIDELSSLFDLDNRKIKKIIENTLRLINHNNNVLILCGTPENFKKFLSAKVDVYAFKKCTLRDFINGSTSKNIINAYNGYEKGSEVLNLAIDEMLLFDGYHYEKKKVEYLEDYDSKQDNVSILQKRSKKCSKNVPEIVRYKK